MDVEQMVRRLSGAFRNAVVWGGTWFALAAAVAFGIRAGDVSPLIALGDALFTGARVGVIGGVAGGAFALLISVLYRGRRLSDISWLRFGAGGAIMAGLFVPAFLMAGNLATGDGFAVLPYVLDDGLMAAVFGGITAAGSMRLAQHADALVAGESREQLDGGRGVNVPGAAEAPYAPARTAR